MLSLCPTPLCLPRPEISFPNGEKAEKVPLLLKAPVLGGRNSPCLMQQRIILLLGLLLLLTVPAGSLLSSLREQGPVRGLKCLKHCRESTESLLHRKT